MAGGLLNVVSNAELEAQEAAAFELEEEQQKHSKESIEDLALYIRHKFYDFRKTRESRGIAVRLLESLRAFRGQYSDTKLAEIQKFGGAEVYARTTATKCRGATAMLRDIYLGSERPWFMDHTPEPKVPGDIESSILSMVQMELQNMSSVGQEVDPQMIEDRISQLRKSAKQATLKIAKDEAKAHTRKIDDILVEGGFYDALGEFLLDLTVFPYACMKGPVVEMANHVEWVEGKAEATQKPKMFWRRVNPFDIYWASGVTRFADTDVIEHIRMTPTELSNMIGVKGYDEKAIRKALDEYGQGGLSDWLDYTDTEEARLEQREDPYFNNEANLIDTLQWNGKIQGKLLKQWKFSKVKDMEKYYHVIAWIVGDHIIKVMLDPNPQQRHPYYMTSFEKIPGAILGHGIPELIGDIQSVMNATLRALVNNLSIASGPQVTVNVDRMGPNTNPNDLHPWKRWFVEDDPLSQSKEPPVSFWQPNSNAQELLFVFQSMSNLADEVSTIPKYMTGNEKVGGAGRTASGLSMLMGATSKVLQSVASNVDNDVIGPALQDLHNLLLMSNKADEYRGDESVRVRGVNFTAQKETERVRSLEFLQMTGNPIDMGIIGPDGRAEVLREVADALGMDHASIVPDAETLKAQQEMAARNAMAAPGGAPPGAAGSAQQPGPGAGNVDDAIQGIAPTG